MAEFDLETVRYKLHTKAPYLRRVIWALRPVHTPGLGTFGVDARGRLSYDDQVPWTIDEQVAVLLHEINHLIRNHHGRMAGRDQFIWNLAGDAEINDDLDGLPAGCVTPSTFQMNNGLTAEEYYHDIMQKAPKLPQKGDQLNPGAGNCGTVAGGGEEGQDPKDQDGNPVKGMSDISQEAMRRELAKDIREASQTRGNVPGSYVEWANELLEPRVAWQKVLAVHVKRALAIVSGGATDYTFTRRSRRDTRPWIRPKAITRKPSVACVIDTSGSVSDSILNQFISELQGIFKATTQAMTVYFVDAAVQDVQVVSTGASVKLLKPKGRGGTDMRVGIDAAIAQRNRPNIIIVLTDGETPWPDVAPFDIHVIAAISNERDVDVPGWMKKVRVE